jgi:hypothetical protein
MVKKHPKNNYRNADEPYDTLAKPPKVEKTPRKPGLKNDILKNDETGKRPFWTF